MDFLEEDADIRKVFDSDTYNIGGNPLDVIRLALISWAEDNSDRHFGKHCAIMANELTKHIKNNIVIQ